MSLSHSGPAIPRSVPATPRSARERQTECWRPGAKAPRSILPRRHERGNRSWSSTGQPVRWHRPGDDAVRHAGDLDYRLVVVRDCCADPDAEVHAMLLDIVIAKQAAVVTTAELAAPLSGGAS